MNWTLFFIATGGNKTLFVKDGVLYEWHWFKKPTPILSVRPISSGVPFEYDDRIAELKAQQEEV